MQDPVTSLVVTLFAAPGVALGLAAVVFLCGVALILWSSFTEYQPLLRELTERWNRLQSLSGGDRRKSFAAAFAEIDLRFSSVTEGPQSLALGWANYRGLLTQNGDVLATTARAHDAFEPLDEPARALEWWANILIAIGLVITFLGIVAALSEATASVGAGGSSAMQTALMGLLAIAATKFWTSIAGVLASVMLRIVARFRRKRIRAAEDSLFAQLDGCVRYLPPEKVMVEQLNALDRIEAALSSQAPVRA